MPFENIILQKRVSKGRETNMKIFNSRIQRVLDGSLGELYCFDIPGTNDTSGMLQGSMVDRPCIHRVVTCEQFCSINRWDYQNMTGTLRDWEEYVVIMDKDIGIKGQCMVRSDGKIGKILCKACLSFCFHHLHHPSRPWKICWDCSRRTCTFSRSNQCTSCKVVYQNCLKQFCT